jgi:hypothetical protein
MKIALEPGSSPVGLVFWAWARKLPTTTGLQKLYIRAGSKEKALQWFWDNGYEVDNDKIHKGHA